MNIENLKNSLESYGEKYNLTFVKKIARRNEFLFSLGESKFLPKEIIWENIDYALLGEGVEEEVKINLKDMINKIKQINLT